MKVINLQCHYNLQDNLISSYFYNMDKLSADHFINSIIIEPHDVDKDGVLQIKVRELMLKIFNKIPNIKQYITKVDLLSRHMKYLEHLIERNQINFGSVSGEFFQTCKELMKTDYLPSAEKIKLLKKLSIKEKYGPLSFIWKRLSALRTFLGTLFKELSWGRAKQAYNQKMNLYLQKSIVINTFVEVQQILQRFFLTMGNMIGIYQKEFAEAFRNENDIDNMVKEAEVYRGPNSEWFGLRDMEAIPDFFDTQGQVESKYKIDPRIDVIPEQLKPLIKKTLQKSDDSEIIFSAKAKIILYGVIMRLGVKMANKFKDKIESTLMHPLIPLEFINPLNKMFRNCVTSFPELKIIAVNFLMQHTRSNIDEEIKQIIKKTTVQEKSCISLEVTQTKSFSAKIPCRTPLGFYQPAPKSEDCVTLSFQKRSNL